MNLGSFLRRLYRIERARPLVRWLLERLEGGLMRSESIREIYREYEGVTLGRFSRGAGIQPGVFTRGTRIGAFCSFGRGLQVLGRNHPPGRISQHPLFFNARLGMVSRDTVGESSEKPLVIGNDVWTGLNVIICPGCKEIGDGAIIGAGAVVTKKVEPYTIVAGNPARVIRRRFSAEAEAVVAASRWWEWPVDMLEEHLGLFTRELDDSVVAELKRVTEQGGLGK